MYISLGKEVISYQKEYVQQQARIDKLIAQNADIHDINKQVKKKKN